MVEVPRSENEARLLQQDNLQYYGAIIVPPQGSLQIRTPPDGCEHDNLGKDLNKKRPLDPAPERHVPIEQDEHEEEGREECKVNCKTCCLALTCVLDCCPHWVRLKRRIHQRSKIRKIRTEGWKLLWSVLVPLALKPLNLLWLPTQLIMALVLIVISALDWHDSPLDTSALTISSLWTVLTLIDGAVLILSNSSVRRTLVQWFRPRNIPDENQLTSDNESSCKYYIQGYAPVVRFLYSCFCLLPLVLVEGFSAVQTVAANAALGSSGNGTVNLTVNLTEYVLSGEYNNL